jgi:Protein of unknown function (DUF1566)
MRRAIRCVAAALVACVATAALAGAPAGLYQQVAGPAVLDTKTKLTWQHSGITTMSQPDAVVACASLGAQLGGSGWRLPTIKELQTLVDYGQATSPMIDRTAFPSTPGIPFWTSTPFSNGDGTAWAISFADGMSLSGPSSDVHGVRCVR